jgi:hypothetical protein
MALDLFASRCGRSWGRGMVLVVWVAWSASLAARSWAQLPRAQLTTVFPAGAKAGTTVEVTITGTDSEDVRTLVFDRDGFKVEPVLQEKEGKQVPVPNRFRITVSSDVPPGYYDVRALGRFGLSNPRTFVVSDFDETLEAEPNNSPDRANPVLTDRRSRQIMNGQVNGATDVDYFALSLKRGQRILIECEADRIDSRLNPVVTLYDAKNRELASNDNYVGRDAFVDFTAPEDGTYYVMLSDQVFDGSTEHFYRLRVGQFPFIDYVLPAAVKLGEKQKLTLFGRLLPGGKPAEGLYAAGRPLEVLETEVQPPAPPASLLHVEGLVSPVESVVDGFDYRLKTDQGTSNAIHLNYTTLPVDLVREPNDQPDQSQPVSPPVEVHGTFQAPNDRDWFEFEAKAGQVWWFQVLSQRLGFRADPYLVVQRVRDGAVLARVDDDTTDPVGLRFWLRSADSLYRWAAPEDGKYRAMVRDLYAAIRGDARLVYRLVLRPEQPDFRILVLPEAPPNQQPESPAGLVLRKGQNELLAAYLWRTDGFAGEVELTVEGLPNGVECPGATFGPGQNYAPLVLHVREDAPEGISRIRVMGRAKAGDRELVREARYGTILWPYNPQVGNPSRARLARAAYCSVVSELAPYQLTAQPATLEIARGLTATVRVSVKRQGDFKGDINGITAVSLPPNVPNASINISGGQNEGTLSFRIPIEVPVGSYTLVLRGTATVPYTKDPSGQNKANVAVFDPSTPVKLTVVDPISLAFDPQPPLKLKVGTKGEVLVRVHRRGGFSREVQLQPMNVPNTVAVPAVTVAANAGEAKIVFEVAAGATPGQYGNVLLRAQAPMEGQTFTLDVPLPLQIEPAP